MAKEFRELTESERAAELTKVVSCPSCLAVFKLELDEDEEDGY